MRNVANYETRPAIAPTFSEKTSTSGQTIYCVDCNPRVRLAARLPELKLERLLCLAVDTARKLVWSTSVRRSTARRPARCDDVSCRAKALYVQPRVASEAWATVCIAWQSTPLFLLVIITDKTTAGQIK
ncbi:hypothetical protein LSAT2_020183, partial [Lamellibrachia satsuma]